MVEIATSNCSQGRATLREPGLRLILKLEIVVGSSYDAAQRGEQILVVESHLRFATGRAFRSFIGHR
jgi:hypothetical protein